MTETPIKPKAWWKLQERFLNGIPYNELLKNLRGKEELDPPIIVLIEDATTIANSYHSIKETFRRFGELSHLRGHCMRICTELDKMASRVRLKLINLLKIGEE